MKYLVALFVAAMVLAPTAVRAAAVTYSVTALPSNVVAVFGLNNNGTMLVSTTYDPVSARYPSAFCDSAGTVTMLSIPSYYPPYLTGINDSLQVVGEVRYSQYSNQTGFSTIGGTLSSIFTPGYTEGTSPNIQVRAVNNTGQVIGSYIDPFASPTHSNAPYIWTASSFTDLTAHGLADTDAVYDINDRGAIVGGELTSSDHQVFYWKNNVKHSLVFSPTSSYHNRDSGTCINYDGQIGGSGTKLIPGNNYPIHIPVIWSPDTPDSTTGTLAVLESLNPSNPDSQVNDLNDRGVAVGDSVFSTYDVSHGCYWTVNGGIIDLNAAMDPGSGITIKHAGFINNSGVIAALATNNHWYRLTPHR